MPFTLTQRKKRERFEKNEELGIVVLKNKITSQRPGEQQKQKGEPKDHGTQQREHPCIWKKAEQSCDVPEATVYTQTCASGGGHGCGKVETVM